VEEAFYTTGEAAKILRVTESRIRQLLGAGELEGSRDPVSDRWRIPQHAVHARMESMPREPRVQESHAPSPDVNALIERIASLEHQLGRAEATAELTEQTHSTLQEQLGRERERADEQREQANHLQEQAEQLRSELEAERSKGFWARLLGQ
jgi:excisionase family DNA binding protein